MTTELWVGASQPYHTLAAAVAASHAGDTIYVQAGTYTNDWATIDHPLSIIGVGGLATFTSTTSIANGKANLIAQADLTIANLEFTGASVPDANGAGIRYEAGNLTVLNSSFHDNQEGILAAGNAAGNIVIKNSSFVHNGAWDGQSHGVYIGTVASLAVDNSYFSDQNGGSDLKSRAAKTTVTNSVFADPATGHTNYMLDLPNGGIDVVQNNTFIQSSTPGNSNIIHFGGEVSNPAGSLLVSGNTIASRYGVAVAVLDQTSLPVEIASNGFNHIATVEYGGPANIHDNMTLASFPATPAWSLSLYPVTATPSGTTAISSGTTTSASGSGATTGTIHGTGWVFGTSGNDQLVGDSGQDSLVGNGGNDTFTGGLYMEGKGGNDVFNVALTNAHIVEPPANGATVMSSVSYSLDASTYNVTRLTLTGSGNINGTGAWTNDVLVGNSGNNLLIGNGGTDTFTGGGGNDTLVGSAGKANLAIFADSFGSHGFSGTAANLTVTGTDGTDLLQNIATLQFSDRTISTADALAGASSSTSSGGTTATAPAAPSSTTAIHGTGWVFGTSGSDQLVGDSGHDSLVGNGGNDTFTGGLYMEGKGGNDVFNVALTNAHIVEPPTNGATVMSSVSYSLYDSTYNVTKLTLTGTGAINGTGAWTDDVLVGNSGNNLLVGNGGTDTFTGGGGNDTLVGSAGKANLAIFTDSFGSHGFAGTAANLTVTGTDGTDLLQNIATLQFSDRTISTADALAGAATSSSGGTTTSAPAPAPSSPTAIHGTGWVFGTSGSDQLVGDSGHDSLVGNGGNDTFTGGLYMEGKGGADVFNVALSNAHVVEPPTNGATVMSSVSYSLYDSTYNVTRLTLTGSGNLTATGSWGRDVLTGNAGSSTLDGLGGADTLVGGSGHDTFVFKSASYENSVIQGFTRGQDVIDLHGVLAQVGAPAGDALASHAVSLVQNGADTDVIVADHGASHKMVTLQGVAASSLSASDFHF